MKIYRADRSFWTSLLVAAFVFTHWFAAQAAVSTFIIEAEDFNFGGGQHLPQADAMPYYGGAYSGLDAIAEIDYSRPHDGSSDLYRVGEYPNQPMVDNPDYDRGEWTVTTNFRLGWINPGYWYNYTRDFPAGVYKVNASLSNESTADGALSGSLALVTRGATTTSQTLQDLGIFDAPGSGGWGLNNLVPLKDVNGNTVAIELGGVQTLRFTTGLGDFDYIEFIPTGPPQIITHPTNRSVVENEPATFTVELAGNDPASYQWQIDQVDIPGATERILTYPPRFSQSGSRIRVIITNPYGTATSNEAILTVTARDTTRPSLAQAINSNVTSVRVRFSEQVTVPSGPVANSFSISPSLTVSSATQDTDADVITLTVSGMSFGTTYTLTVNNVNDRADIPNTILSNSTIQFTASQYAPTDIGEPGLPGGVVPLPSGGFDVTGAGEDIGSSSDQFQFGWEQRSGDFDIQARLADVVVTDAFLKAGLMARETLDANARFAAVFASSAQVGCLFESRSSTGASSSTSTAAGGFPVNYPQTWLRLRRAGSTLTGYASLDGQLWTQLGSISLSGLPTTLFFGLAVTSVNPDETTTVRFEDVGPTDSPTLGTPARSREPLGPSSRSTGLTISEIMYHPAERSDALNLEFIEIYNARQVAEDLTGYRISSDIDYRFPDGLILQAGETVVVAADPDAVMTVYGISGVLGPYTNSLPNDAGTIRLRNNIDAIRLEVNYEDDRPWPVAADGAGHSLVLAFPSYGENSPKAWTASSRIGGSPGQIDAVYSSPLQNVMINEFLAHTDDPQYDFIELYNHSNQSVDVSGCILTDDISTNRFVIPVSTSIPARGHLAYDQWDLGFALNSAGETIYFLNPDRTQVLDAIRFRGQENGVSSGRTPDGAPTIQRLQTVTLGSANAPRRVESVVVNEIMYHPISLNNDDEYIELHNRTGSAVDLTDWRLREGASFRFPTNTTIAAGGYLVVARNAANLIPRYPQLTSANTLGDYSGSLRDGGDRIVLTKPDTVVNTNLLGGLETNVIHIVVADITYEDGGRWGQWADGGGSSLELIDPAADPLRASSWADSDETQKAGWTLATFTGRLDLGRGGYNPDRFHILMQGPGECVVDDIQIYPSGGANQLSNGNFESGTSNWTIQGNHGESSVELGIGYNGTRGMHVRAGGDGDTGINSLRAVLSSGLSINGTATIQARVRWMAGWPQVLFKTRGGWIEMSADMNLPTNLGSPGQANSRRVTNAGPAIFDVQHSPALPQSAQTVMVTCRVSDPDDIASVQLRYRTDPSTTYTALTMRDDGLSGDAIANDGVYSGRISGRSSGTLIAFHIRATDDAAAAATSQYPVNVPDRECLIRWGDPLPSGTFAQYSMWSTSATENALNSTTGLNNTWRDTTLVYGDFRVIYNVNFRHKGSPYHGGTGDYALALPKDDLLLGVTDRVFASTGNGGSEATAIRSQLAAWLGQQLEIPYLHAHYMQLYRNGSQFRNITEDLQQPNHSYAEQWFPGGEGDLYKIAVWFEFLDDNSNFGATSATLQRFTSGGDYKLGRYRWNWQRRSNDGDANNFGNFFELVTAANDSAADWVPDLLGIADIEQWMRVHGYNRVTANWDAWTYSVGQNMYLYKTPGLPWVIMPWDVDFTFGLGDNASAGLWGGQDPNGDRLYNTPTFRRMLWRLYIDAVNGPMLPENFGPQIEARRRVLLRNNVSGLTPPDSIYTFMASRRNYILGQIQANNASAFTIATNGGNDYNSQTPTTTLTGIAPFEIASIAINGTPYPVTWNSFTSYAVTVPLTQATNVLNLVGLDRKGQPIPGMTRTITVTYPGAIQKPEDYVAITEVHYNPLESGSSFLELFNRSTTTPFDLSGFRVNGVDYTFPAGSIIQPQSHLLIVRDRPDFVAVYGDTLNIFDEFAGSLDNGGETITLYRPGTQPGEEIRVSEVRYEDTTTWPFEADGQGASLQIIDPEEDSYRRANWAVADTNSVNRTTPGRPNSVAVNLPAFPAVWINEILPENLTGITDNAGDREPWIELYNAGDNSIDLSAYYLTDDYANLAKWQFPAGATIAAGEFLVLWADGEPSESTVDDIHTSFRLTAGTGSVALVRLQGSPAAPAIMDYADYIQLSGDRSFGSYPDGEPRKRRLFHTTTPTLPNDPTSPQIDVVINELMAGNTLTIEDPADNDYDDWFELYNAGSEAVDLTSYTLTDNLTNSTKFVIPAGTVIPPGGFLLVWADEETGQNQPGSDLHVNFRLSLNGEQLGLFSPDTTAVHTLSFGAQTNDISAGLYPDGVVGQLLFLEAPTPGQPNLLAGGNIPPTLDPVGNHAVPELSPLTFTATASDPDEGQSLTFSLTADAPPGASIDSDTGAFNWTPSESDGPGSFGFAIQVTDDGAPPRTAGERITVTVTEVNQSPSLAPVPDQVVDEGSLLALTVSATDPDLPANALTYGLGPNAPQGMSIDSLTGQLTWTPTEDQGPANHPVTVRVTDDGTPALSHSRTFTVTVNEANNVPVFQPVPPQSSVESVLFSLTVTAADPDTPPAPLIYSLDVAPPGATVDPDTGTISWTPTEAQGPTNAVFVVRATENVPPGMSSTATFAVSVTEDNQNPSIGTLADQVVAEGEILVLNVTARDNDLPLQSLTFSLLPGAPEGMTLDANTGALVWPVGPDVGVIDQDVSVQVSDNATPAGTASRTFRVTVIRGPHLVINEIMAQPETVNADYIEIYNNSTNAAEVLDGLILQGSNLSYTFPTGSQLGPDEYLLVVGDSAVANATYSGNLAISGEYSGTLNPAGDTLQLILAGATPAEDIVIDEVTYSLDAPWPPAAATGASLQLIDPLEDNQRVSNWDAVDGIIITGPAELVSYESTWSYNQSGTDLGTSWKEPAYNDSGWPSGPGLLYVEDQALPATKGTELTLGPITFYFRTRFEYNGGTEGVTLNLSTIIDDGAVFYLNGVEIYRLRIPPGPVDASQLSDASVGDAAIEGPFVVPADALQRGENVLAVEVHQWDTTSSDVVLGAQLEIEGGNVEPFTPGYLNSIRSDLPAYDPIWLNEVLPDNDGTNTDALGHAVAWVELYNAGPLPVSLEDYYLSDSFGNLIRWTFLPGSSLEAGEYRLVWVDADPAENNPSEWHTTFRIPTTVGSIVLSRLDADATRIVDYLNYDVSAADEAFGSTLDGSPSGRGVLASPTPEATNSPGTETIQFTTLGLNVDGHLDLTWTALPGQTYRIEFKDRLDDANWSVGGEVPADGDTASFMDTTLGSSSQRFYRVLRLD